MLTTVSCSEDSWNCVNTSCYSWGFFYLYVSAEQMLLCKHSFVDLVLKIVSDIGQSRLLMCSMDIAAFLCFVLEMSVMFMEMALKSSLWGEACYGNRSLPICLWNKNLVHYYEKKCFMVLSLASSHPVRRSAGSFGEEYIKTSGLNTHMCSFHLQNAYYCYVLWIPES